MKKPYRMASNHRYKRKKWRKKKSQKHKNKKTSWYRRKRNVETLWNDRLMTERNGKQVAVGAKWMAAQWNDQARLDATRLSTFHLRMAKKCTEVNGVGVSYSSHDYFMRISSAQLFLLLRRRRFFFLRTYLCDDLHSLIIHLSFPLFSCIFFFFPLSVSLSILPCFMI